MKKRSVFLVMLSLVILFSFMFHGTTIMASNFKLDKEKNSEEMKKKEEITKILSEYNIKSTFVDEDDERMSSAISMTMEEFKEYLDEMENEEPEIKLEVIEGNMMTKNPYEIMPAAVYQKTVVATINRVYYKVLTEVDFLHYSSGSFYGCEKFLSGKMRLSGLTIAHTLKGASVRGQVRNGQIL